MAVPARWPLTNGLLAAAAAAASLWLLGGIAILMQADQALLTNAFASDAGWEASLPPEVVDAKRLLAAHSGQWPELRLSAELQANALLDQRMTDALYPVRFVRGGPLLLTQLPFTDNGQCHVLAKGKYVAVVECR